jgi:glycosyltransferase involved in cell wall biosynthesis
MAGRLRIALVLETSGGGSGRHVLDLARGLVARGQDVSVIWAPDRAQEDFVAALHAIDGVTALPVSMSRSVGPRDAKSLRALRDCILAQAPFDILHAHSSKAGALIRLLPRAVPGARIYTPHAFRTMDPELGQPQRMIYGTIERLLAPRAARIIPVSDAEHAHAVGLGIAPARLSTVVNGVSLPRDATRDAARLVMGLDEGDVAVGLIGRLDHQKDPLRFVRAVSLAAETVPVLKGVVIGDGPLRAQAEAVAHPGAVRFLGWRDGPRLMPGLDIFCMTSRYEAMPYTLLEALHAGVPIVTTAVGGAPESVIEGETGHILPLDAAPQAIADVLCDLAGDEARRAAFGAAAADLAAQRTIDVMLDNTIAVYRSAQPNPQTQ